MWRLTSVIAILMILQVSGQANAQPTPCDPSGKSLELEPHQQETDVWCWAASAQMIMEFHGSSQAQCFIVDATYRDSLSIDTCCGRNKEKDECLIRGRAGKALTAFSFTVGQVVENPDPFRWKDLTGQICRGLPFIFAAAWGKGGFHTHVVQGYKVESDGDKVVEIYDHFGEDFEERSFDDLVPDPGEDMRYRVYTDIEPPR